MSTSSIPISPSLEFYQKQAKALVRSVLSADQTALARVRQHLPRYASGDPFLLSDAQWLIAREHGFVNWAAFRRQLAEVVKGTEEDVSDITVQSMENSMTDTKTSSNDQFISDDAVRAKTGKGWDEWFAIFDGAGCAKMNHQDIVAVANKYGVGPWWRQMVAVKYERARGLRAANQSCSGEHHFTANKTINAPAVAVFDAWTEPDKREKWLPGAQLTIRKATSPKSVRITWHDATSVEVMIYPKGDTKCSCTADHRKLAGPEFVEPLRAYWTAAMGRLKEFVEG